MNGTLPLLDIETSIPPLPLDLAKAEPTRVFPVRVQTQEPADFNVELLDKLMNLASAMVLGRNKLVRLSEKEGSAVDGLRSIVQEINLVTSEMQSTIMRARLHPMGKLFGKLTSIVSDLGQMLSKEITLEIVGNDVEIDRLLLDGLAAPLARLVHNCAAHGIESREERNTLGKPTSGRIFLSAAHLNGRVQIEVRDDGRGLDPAKLKARAVDIGFLSPESVAQMTDAEACQLLFISGFSTSDSSSSGSEIAMDVLKSNIEKLGGDVELASEPNCGTSATIHLPLTLTIIPALVVTCGGQSFAVPQINLEEIVVPSPTCRLESLGSGMVVRLREELLPVLDLASILGQTHIAPESRYVLVLHLDHTRFGLLVDDISNTEEIVVKPLSRELKSVTMYSGATLLGQGDIALILDLAALAHGRLPSEVLGAAASLVPTISQIHADSERVLVFSDASPERFAIHLNSIARIEHIPASRIERIGDRECLRQKTGPTIHLIRPGHFLPTTPPAPYGEEIFVIVPKMSQRPVGIIASEIVDSVDLETSMIDCEIFDSTAILGASTLLERLTLVIDVDGLLRAAGFGEA